MSTTIQNITAKKLEWKEIEGEHTWYHAMELGKNGWRLPAKEELVGLYTSGLMPSDKTFWSFTGSTNYASSISFSDGGIDYWAKTTANHVRLVREIKD